MTQETMYRLLQVLRDPKMGYRPYTIYQTEYTRQGGKLIENRAVYGTGGVIHPGTEGNRDLLPEEYRQEEYIHVYCRTELTSGEEKNATRFRAADIIDPYDGTYWRVVKVIKWGKYPDSFYAALAVKTNENLQKKIKEAENERSDL